MMTSKVVEKMNFEVFNNPNKYHFSIDKTLPIMKLLPHGRINCFQSALTIVTRMNWPNCFAGIFLLTIITFLASNHTANAQDFITQWQTTSPAESVTIPTVNSANFNYSYTVNWGDGTTDATTYTGDASHTYSAAGTYTVSIAGQFDQIFFNDSGDKDKIVSIDQWGSQRWKSLENSFRGCSNLVYNATDRPDLSVATSMARAFMNATSFTGNLINWNVSNITDLSAMFEGASAFSSNLTNWNVSNVTTMSSMFKNASAFNGNISSWDVSNVTNMSSMFRGASAFNQNISAWDVSNVTRMFQMFENATVFNNDISQWDVGNVSGSFNKLFKNAAAFNQDLSGWDVSGVEFMFQTFANATVFNGDVSTWDVSNVIDMFQVFSGATVFNRDISGWDVSNVENFQNAFSNAKAFNQDLSTWNMSAALQLSGMFTGATAFNGDISTWDVSNATSLEAMFFAASSFNQDISNWDVSNTTNLNTVFNAAIAFDQDLSPWDISNVTTAANLFTSSGLSTYHYDRILEGWSTLESGETAIPSNISLGTFAIGYCNSASARSTLINTYNWIINDAGETCTDFITTWKTTTNSESITIPTNGTGYSYTVDWGDGTSDATTYNGDATHVYVTAGSFIVTISGDFPGIYFNNGPAKDLIQSIDQWGTGQWSSMENAFYGCSNLTIAATDIANVTQVSNMSFVFADAPLVDFDISQWDVSLANQMTSMFENAAIFNQDLSGWDISNVTDMNNMLDGTSISTDNYDLILNGWSTLSTTETQIPTGISLGVNGLIYCESASSRDLLTATYSWTIVGDEIDFDCLLLPLGDQQTDEAIALSFTAEVNDRQTSTVPLTFSLDQVSLDSGMFINANTGVVQFTPGEIQNGAFSSTVSVTDGFAIDSETITITVDEVNQDPVLSSIGDQSGDENEVLNFTLVTSDADIPSQLLQLSLDQASLDLGMSIDQESKRFSWTPGELENGNYTTTISLSDGFTTVAETITITVNEVNIAPVLDAIGDKSVDENININFDAQATDVDLPANSLTFSLDQPSIDLGMAIDSETGIFSWTPSESQQGVHSVIISVSDGLLTDSETIVVTVNEVETAPEFNSIAGQTGEEETTISFAAGATDVDIPAQNLGFSIDQASLDLGMSIDENTGVFSWTPAESQDGVYMILATVTDGILSASQSITLTVTEVNQGPVLTAIGTQSGLESSEIGFQATASDGDIPIQELSFSIDQSSLDLGMSIGAESGLFAWTPSESQDGGFEVIVTATDGISSAEEVVAIVVSEVNQAPVLTAIGDQSVDEGTTFNLTAAAIDADLPVQALTYSLDEASRNLGMEMDAVNGLVTWIPDETQEGSYSVTISVSDGELVDTETFTVIVNEVNDAPLLDNIEDLQGKEETSFTFRAQASDIDLPAQSLTFSLDQNSLDLGMTLEAESGVFSWIPGEAQNGVFMITITVSDGMLDASRSFSIEVDEVNETPVMNPIDSRVVTDNSDISFTIVATDFDLPAQMLTFSLDQESVELGMTIDASTGYFSYASADFKFGTFQVVATVSDGFESASEEFTLEIQDVNQAPVLTPIDDVIINEGEVLSFDVVATDSGLPDQTLSYTLDEASTSLGMTIGINSGTFSWTPGETFDGSFLVEVTVSDGELAAAELFLITVSEVNEAPVLAPVENLSVNEGETIAFTLEATDVDVPEQNLSYSLDQASVDLGMQLDMNLGAFSWTPDESQDGSYSVTFTVSDGSLTDETTFDLVVAEVNDSPILTAIADQTGLVGNEISFTVLATDADLPTQSLSFSIDQNALDLGMTIDAATGVFSWMLTSAGEFQTEVTVTDGIATDVKSFSITVQEDIVLHAGSANELQLMAFPNPAENYIVLKMNNLASFSLFEMCHNQCN